MIDSHCHLADEVFATDRHAVLERARAAGLAGALCIIDATSDAEGECAGQLAAAWDGLRFAVGVHPHLAGRFAGRPAEAAALVERRLAHVQRVVAVGEIGLDYHYDFAPRDVQREVFRAQLHLARQRDLPVVIHAREADHDGVEEIRGCGHDRGVFHCFTGGLGLARQVLDLGFFVSLAGIVTFPKAHELREVARFVPADRLLVETDSPYLAPVPHRGKRNEPAWVLRVAEAIAGTRAVTPAVLGEVTDGNFSLLFEPEAPTRRVDSPDGLC